MRLFSFWRSSSAWRVRIVLHYKRIPFEYVALNIAPGADEQHRADFDKINPLRQVPTLEWRDAAGDTQLLTQSVAIAEWLEEATPSPALLPRDALTRARVRSAVEIVNSGVQPLQNVRTLEALRKLGGESAAQTFTDDAISRGLAALEAHAAAHGGAFSVGDELSLADVFLVPQLYNARRYQVDISRYSRLLAIEARAAALPAFQLAHPDVQPDAPKKT